MSVMERPPGPQQRRSTFSLKSDRSHGSNKHNKHQKEQFRESVEEKRRTHISESTKANPNAAMNEAQPIAAALEKPTLQSLRSFQHTDTNGKIISDPDLSNPTRSRWERPLDTIRSFEAAIDKEYRQRAPTMMRPDSTADQYNGGYASRRSSYYGGNGYDQPGNRFSTFSGNYGGRGPRDSWAESGYSNGYGQPPPPRARYNRMQSEPMYGRYSNGQDVYPSNGYQQSRDTFNSGGSNGSQSEPYSNEPSENSSFERPMPVQPVQKADLGEQYGFTGFGGGPILEEYGDRYGPGDRPQDGYYSSSPNGMNGPPPVPVKNYSANNGGPIKLGAGQSQAPAVGGTARPNLAQRDPEKRKSWFKRRFSKEK